jgi:endonuclease III
VVLAATKLGIVKKEVAEDALKQLKDFWSKNKVAGKSFINFETALLRLGKDYCRKEKCTVCPVKDECLSREVP